MFKHTKHLTIAMAFCLVPACGATGTQSDGPAGTVEQKLSNYYTYTPVDGDSRGYTSDGDWSPGFWKGECALNQLLTGISRSFSSQPSPGRMHRMLCTGPLNGNMNPTNTLTIGSSDTRADTSTGDWDSGYVKVECAYNETMSGISQGSTGVLMNARCDSTGFYASSCHTVQFPSGGDNRYSSNGGDWDVTYQKNQCGNTEYVKGISKYSNGLIKSMLCCSYSTIIY